MDPYFNNGLFPRSTTPPALTQDNMLLDDATGYDSYNCYSHTPLRVPEPHSALQADFGEAPQLSLDGREKLRDISTWDMQTLREVATSVAQEANGNPAFFDLQDQWLPSPQDTTEPFGVFNDEDNDDDEDDDAEDALGACGGLNSNYAPLYAAPDTRVDLLPSDDAAPRQRKLKMYEWPPQTDPVLEKRRRRAVRQREQRLKEDKLEMDLRRQLEERKREVAKLTAEAQQRQQIVRMLQERAAQQGYNGLPPGNY